MPHLSLPLGLNRCSSAHVIFKTISSSLKPSDSCDFSPIKHLGEIYYIRGACSHFMEF